MKARNDLMNPGEGKRLISEIFKDNGRTTVSCGGAQGVLLLLLLLLFIKSDTHYKNPWSHAKLFFRQTNVTLWSNYQLNYLLDRQRFWHNDQI